MCMPGALALIALLLIAVAPNGTRAATMLPDRFVETPIIPSGLVKPTTMAFAPDGRLFIAEQGGRLRVYKDGELLSTPAITLAVNSDGERGLLGIAFDPGFAINQHIYLYYTTSSNPIRNRVSRFTMDGDTIPDGSERILIQMEPLDATNHNGGAIHFGTDNKLYIAVGENAVPDKAQRLDTLKGKMLRLNADGTIPPDNPFYTSASGKRRAIWALGLRNPFRFAVQPGAGRIFINDVGSSGEGVFEEINLGRKGANYGWPITEGPTSDPRFVAPLYTYTHDADTCAITGGTFYNPPVRPFPVEYTGDYFFADLWGQWIKRLDVPSDTVSKFASGTPGGLVDVQVGPDGNLYYLARNGGLVRRIEYQNPAMGTELLANGSFEVPSAASATLPEAWRALGVTTDRTVCTMTDRPNGKPDKLVADEGSCAFRFFGAPGKFAQLMQRLAGTAVASGDVLTLSGVVHATNVPDSTGLIRARITYEDGTGVTLRITVPGGTYGYSGFTAAPRTLEKPVASIKVAVRYTGAQGTMTVDRISLKATNLSAGPRLPVVGVGQQEGEPIMPLLKYGANFPYARQELLALFAYAQQDDVEQGGRYEARDGVLYVWSHAWRTQAMRDESTLVGSFYVNWLTERLTQIEWDEGFELADLLHELALLEEKALGSVKHGRKQAGW